jgi:deoxyribonuclease IV
MAMKILVGTAGIPHCAEEKSTAGGVRKVAQLGLHSMEVEFVRGVSMTAGKAEELGRLAKDLRIRLSAHAPYYINLCNPEKLRDSEKRIMESCHRAHLMGAGVVVFHPGFYGKLSGEDALGMVEGACREMGDAIEDNGFTVKLGLETTGKASQFGTIDEILSICRVNRHCVPVIDWCHIFAKSQGKVDFASALSKVTDAGFRKIHTHFSGVEFTDKGERRHITIGHRQPDFSLVAGMILKSDLHEINIISESPEMENDALAMKGILEGLGHRF